MFDLVEFLGADNFFARLILDWRSNLVRTRMAASLVDGLLPGIVASSTGVLSENFAFESYRSADTDRTYWRLVVCISECKSVQDLMRIEIYDSQDRPIESGQLSFMGLKMVVENGLCHCPVSQIRDGLVRNAGVYFTSRKHGCFKDEGRPTWKVSSELAGDIC